jgi:imidazolonepropionase-like amidohydrolase
MRTKGVYLSFFIVFEVYSANLFFCFNRFRQFCTRFQLIGYLFISPYQYVMKIKNWCFLFLAMLGGPALLAQGSAPDFKPATRTYALTNATVIVKPGQTIPQATVVIKDGLIHAVGANLPVPADARVIKADSMFVYAGFIDALSYAGIPQRREEAPSAMGQPGQQRPRTPNAANPSNEEAGIQPEVKAREVVSAKEPSLADLRKLGFTTAHIVPQGRMLPGSGAVFLLDGNTADEMLVKDQTSLFATLNGARSVFPSTVIGVMAKFRELYIQAQQAKAHENAYALNPAGMVKPNTDKSLQAFYPVLEKKMPVFYVAEDVKALHRVMTLQQDLGFPLVMAGLKQGWYVVDMIKSKNIPVILSADLPKAKEAPKPGAKKAGEEAKKDPEVEQLEARAAEEMKKLESQAAVFAGKGVSFGFGSFNGKTAEMRENFRRMIKNGLTEDQALAALTTTPANMLGLSQGMGTVEKGKMANLTVCDKPYFTEKSNVRMVFVNGNLFEYEVPRQNPPAAASAAPAPGAGRNAAVGEWAYQINADGQSYDGVMTLKENNGNVTGIWSSNQLPGDNPITDVQQKGNQLNFSSSLNMGGQSMGLDFEITVEGDTFSGRVKVGAFGTFDVKGSRKNTPRE